jgi:transposase-like protein
MNASIMHKAFGVSKQDCLDMRYEDNNIVLNIQTRKEELCCPRCGSLNVVNNGSTLRRFISVPIGHSKIFLEMRVQRIKCHDCGCICQEDIDFARGEP